MKTYPLVSFEYQGRKYGKCNLTIDEASHQLEVSKSGFLGLRKSVLAKMSYGAKVQAVSGGSMIRLEGMAMTVESDERASEISQLIWKRETQVRQQQAGGLAKAESAALEFLRDREGTIAFISKLKEDPKGALISQSEAWTDKNRDPLDEILEGRSKQLKDAFEKFKASVKETEAQTGEEAIERVFAIVYSLGLIQDGLLTGGDLKAELGFLDELGARGLTVADLELGSFTERISKSLFAASG
jgi:hypothetical protein